MAHKEMRKSRVLLTAAGLFFLLGLLWARVAFLQTAMHEHYAAREMTVPVLGSPACLSGSTG